MTSAHRASFKTVSFFPSVVSTSCNKAKLMQGRQNTGPTSPKVVRGLSSVTHVRKYVYHTEQVSRPWERKHGKNRNPVPSFDSMSAPAFPARDSVSTHSVSSICSTRPRHARFELCPSAPVRCCSLSAQTHKPHLSLCERHTRARRARSTLLLLLFSFSTAVALQASVDEDAGALLSPATSASGGRSGVGSSGGPALSLITTPPSGKRRRLTKVQACILYVSGYMGC